MIKAVIFDFDGVLVESATIKTEAFRSIFSRWPDKVDEAVDYHRKNMGVSRYIKFEHFYRNIICEPYSKEIGVKLAREFSELVVEQVKKASFVKGVREFLQNNYKEYLLFIASGTPWDEIVPVMIFKEIDMYFKDIFGSPASKTEIIKNILDKYLLDKNEVVFVGDAQSDRVAAQNTGVHFIMRINSENQDFINHQEENIYDFTQLEEVIRKIEELV